MFSPVLAAIALWILFETGRPVLFAHPRAGKDGRVFRMLKFRTMVQDAIAVGQAQKISEDPYGHLPDDPRITRSGRFLRRTSLDELPQLVNVVRGEMSLVGPRADIVEQVANYTEADRRRLAVKPGHHGLGAGERPRRDPVAAALRARRLVHRALVARARREDRLAHRARRCSASGPSRSSTR